MLRPFSFTSYTYFHCASQVFPPANSHTCYTPWSVFQDGSVEAILTKSPFGPSGPRRRILAGLSTRSVSGSRDLILSFEQEKAADPRYLPSSKPFTYSTPRWPVLSRQTSCPNNSLLPLPFQRFQVF